LLITISLPARVTNGAFRGIGAARTRYQWHKPQMRIVSAYLVTPIVDSEPPYSSAARGGLPLALS